MLSISQAVVYAFKKQLLIIDQKKQYKRIKSLMDFASQSNKKMIQVQLLFVAKIQLLMGNDSITSLMGYWGVNEIWKSPNRRNSQVCQCLAGQQMVNHTEFAQYRFENSLSFMIKDKDLYARLGNEDYMRITKNNQNIQMETQHKTLLKYAFPVDKISQQLSSGSNILKGLWAVFFQQLQTPYYYFVNNRGLKKIGPEYVEKNLKNSQWIGTIDGTEFQVNIHLIAKGFYKNWIGNPKPITMERSKTWHQILRKAITQSLNLTSTNGEPMGIQKIIKFYQILLGTKKQFSLQQNVFLNFFKDVVYMNLESIHGDLNINNFFKFAMTQLGNIVSELENIVKIAPSLWIDFSIFILAFLSGFMFTGTLLEIYINVVRLWKKKEQIQNLIEKILSSQLGKLCITPLKYICAVSLLFTSFCLHEQVDYFFLKLFSIKTRVQYQNLKQIYRKHEALLKMFLNKLGLPFDYFNLTLFDKYAAFLFEINDWRSLIRNKIKEKFEKIVTKIDGWDKLDYQQIKRDLLIDINELDSFLDGIKEIPTVAKEILKKTFRGLLSFYDGIITNQFDALNQLIHKISSKSDQQILITVRQYAKKVITCVQAQVLLLYDDSISNEILASQQALKKFSHQIFGTLFGSINSKAISTLIEILDINQEAYKLYIEELAKDNSGFKLNGISVRYVGLKLQNLQFSVASIKKLLISQQKQFRVWILNSIRNIALNFGRKQYANQIYGQDQNILYCGPYNYLNSMLVFRKRDDFWKNWNFQDNFAEALTNGKQSNKIDNISAKSLIKIQIIANEWIQSIRLTYSNKEVVIAGKKFEQPFRDDDLFIINPSKDDQITAIENIYYQNKLVGIVFFFFRFKSIFVNGWKGIKGKKLLEKASGRLQRSYCNHKKFLGSNDYYLNGGHFIYSQEKNSNVRQSILSAEWIFVRRNDQ